MSIIISKMRRDLVEYYGEKEKKRALLDGNENVLLAQVNAICVSRVEVSEMSDELVVQRWREIFAHAV